MANYLILGLMTFLFVIGVLWNGIWIFEKNERNTWYNLEVCTNQKGTKILRQLKETSGSIHDFRDRLVIYEFDKNNRISITINVHNYEGPWIIENLKNKSKEKVQILD